VTEIVNLRKARKAKARAEEDARATENRIKFGRSKAERAAGEARERLVRRRLDAHCLKGGDAGE
jgi:hypothetical protein